MLALAVEDFNIFVKNTLVEEYYVTRGSDSLSVECLSTTSMHSISNEGFIDWVKDKLSKLGRRFVVLVNKVVARFSKNREKLEQNIELYKKDPNATVVLAVSPKTLKVISLVTAAVTAGIVAMVLCIPRKDGSTRIAQIYKGLKDRIAKAKDLVKRDKAAKGHPTKASEAAAASEEAIKESKKAEDTVKQAGSKVNDTNPGSDADTAKGSVNNAANATSKIADVVNDVAGLQDTAAQFPKDTGFVTVDVDKLKKRDAGVKLNANRVHTYINKQFEVNKGNTEIAELCQSFNNKLNEIMASYGKDTKGFEKTEGLMAMHRYMCDVDDDICNLVEEFMEKVKAAKAKAPATPTGNSNSNNEPKRLTTTHVAPKQLTDASKLSVADLKKLADEKMRGMRELVIGIVDEMEPKNDEERNNSKFMKLSRKYTRLVNRIFEDAKKSTELAASRGKEDSKLNILNIVADSYDLLREHENEFFDKADAL